MAKTFGIRSLVLFIIVLLIIGWSAILYWAVSHGAIPKLFYAAHLIFSYQSTLVEYRSAIPGLVYPPKRVSAVVEPEYFRLGDLLSAWNPDDTAPARWVESAAHPSKGKGLARFDYSNKQQRELALQYRKAEIPFLVYNVPELQHAISDVFTLPKLQQNIGNEAVSVEKISSNNYMFYHDRSIQQVHKQYPEWTPPQEDMLMTFEEFLGEVRRAESSPDYINSSIPLYYYTISAGKGRRTTWIVDSLPFFAPKTSFFMVDVSAYKGINCRFGMKGVAAAAHYDGRRNFVAMLRGRKRYMLQPPLECKNLELYPRSHPSARHSRVDWSNIEQVKSYPNLYNSRATEVILSMGEMLYIPGNWFHYIVSQDASIQCNSRSGVPPLDKGYLGDCGY